MKRSEREINSFSISPLGSFLIWFSIIAVTNFELSWDILYKLFRSFPRQSKHFFQIFRWLKLITFEKWAISSRQWKNFRWLRVLYGKAAEENESADNMRTDYRTSNHYKNSLNLLPIILYMQIYKYTNVNRQTCHFLTYVGKNC